MATIEHTNALLQSLKDDRLDLGKISDGYHTFDELYEHRILLFIALCRTLYDHHPATHSLHGIKVWRSHTHEDGSRWAGWFIMGLGKIPGRMITYHLPERVWDLTNFAETLDQAPAWDGHTSLDVLDRIKSQFLQP